MVKIQLTEADLVRLVGSQDVWSLEYLSLYQGVEEHIRDEVSLDCHRVAKDRFTEEVGQWLSPEDGTSDNPYTWETVFNKKKLLSLLKGIWQGVVKGYPN